MGPLAWAAARSVITPSRPNTSKLTAISVFIHVLLCHGLTERFDVKPLPVSVQKGAGHGRYAAR
jgi:hypothetical protein